MADVDTREEEIAQSDETEQETAGQEDAAAAATKDDGSPVTAADWVALNEALRKARKDAREAKRAKPQEPTSEAPDVDKVKAEAIAEAAAQWKPRVVKQAARSAFLEAGLVLPKDNADAAMSRALKLLEMDDLDITDDGQVDGLREQVDEIKRDFPELFAAPRTRPGRIDSADKAGQTNGKPRSTADHIANLVLRGA